MQEEFSKLTEEEQRKFLLKNILNKKYFSKVHKILKDKYPKYIYDKSELQKVLKKQKFNNYFKNFINVLGEHTKAVNYCALHQSRYKDVVCEVYWYIEPIEKYCYSKYISSKYHGELIMEMVKRYYDDTRDTICGYGGETCGDQDQTLRKAMKIILNSPHLNNKIKKTEEYKEYYSMFFNKNDANYAGDDYKGEKYEEYEKGKREEYDFTDVIQYDDEYSEKESNSDNDSDN